MKASAKDPSIATMALAFLGLVVAGLIVLVYVVPKYSMSVGQGMMVFALGFPILIAIIWASARIPSLVFGALVFSVMVQEGLKINVGGIGTINQFVGVVFLAIIPASPQFTRQVGMLRSDMTLAIIALLVWLATSAASMSTTPNAWMDVNAVFRGVLFYALCVIALREPRDLAIVTVAYIAGAITVAMVGRFWAAVQEPLQYFQTAGRQGIDAFTPHYVEFAIRCMIPLPVLAALLLRRNSRINLRMLALGALAAVLSASILLSGSRGAVIAWFFMFFAVPLLFGLSWKTTIFLPMLFFFVVLFLPMDEMLRHTSMLTGNLTGEGDSAKDYSYLQREQLVRFAIDPEQYTNLQDMFFGHGLENFRTKRGAPPHSIWLQVLWETGLLGLSINLFILFRIVQLIIRLRSPRWTNAPPPYLRHLVLGWAASMIVLLFWGLFENLGFMIGSKHMFIILGVLVAGRRMLEDAKVRADAAVPASGTVAVLT